jgi:hypothetical protein
MAKELMMEFEFKLKMKDLKEEKLKIKEKEFDLQILFKDTTAMTDTQLRKYEILCRLIRVKHGII